MWIFGPPPPGGPQKNSELNVHFFWNRLYFGYQWRYHTIHFFLAHDCQTHWHSLYYWQHANPILALSTLSWIYAKHGQCYWQRANPIFRYWQNANQTYLTFVPCFTFIPDCFEYPFLAVCQAWPVCLPPVTIGRVTDFIEWNLKALFQKVLFHIHLEKCNKEMMILYWKIFSEQHIKLIKFGPPEKLPAHTHLKFWFWYVFTKMDVCPLIIVWFETS